MKKPPAAVRKYMAEYEQSESDVQDYIIMQLRYFQTILEKGGTTEAQWVAFKLGCSTNGAVAAIKWAGWTRL